jgi:NDP-sugar pyrophosphorylase family protein
MMLPVVILAGGLGSRLGSLTAETPKALIRINEVPFLSWQLNLLEKNNVTEVVLCLGFLSERVISYIESSYDGSIKVRYSLDGPNPLGTGGAIKKAASMIAGPFFVLYGDSYLDVSYEDILDAYQIDRGPLMTIVKNENRLDKSNVFRCKKTFFYQKDNPPKTADYIDFGLSIFQAKHFSKFSGVFDMSEVQSSFSKTVNMQFFEVDTRFYEIGSAGGISDLEEHLSLG